jgi:hypothetical protein
MWTVIVPIIRGYKRIFCWEVSIFISSRPNYRVSELFFIIPSLEGYRRTIYWEVSIFINSRPNYQVPELFLILYRVEEVVKWILCWEVPILGTFLAKEPVGIFSLGLCIYLLPSLTRFIKFVESTFNISRGRIEHEKTGFIDSAQSKGKHTTGKDNFWVRCSLLNEEKNTKSEDIHRTSVAHQKI